MALDYVAMNPGRFLFPIKAGSKFPPLIKNNLADASNDTEQLTSWAKKWPGCNWGVAHRKSNLLVVDIDQKPGKEGEATFDQLDLDYGFPETEENRTPSGGRHLVYEGAHVFALGENGFGKDIDSPNYTMIAGCQFADGTGYEAIKAIAAAPAPAWFYEVLGRAKERLVDAGVAAVELDKPENVAWAVDFLKFDAEPAVEGKSGDLQTVKIAMGLRDRGISFQLAAELMIEHYNERCVPPWEPDALRKKVENAYNYANQSQVGGKTAEADFAEDSFDVESIKTQGDEKRIEREKIEREKQRAREAAVPTDQRQRISNKNDVLDEWVWVADIDRFIKINEPNVMWKRASFDAHFKYLTPKGSRSLSDALFAMTKGTIRRFERIGYQPGEGISLDGGRVCNLFRPSGVIPYQGDTSFFDQHLMYLYPDEEQRNHLLNWLAWFVQNPKRKPKHALLMQGRIQGTGKSYIADMLAAIIGPHNATAVSQTDLGSDFNGYAMRTKLIVIEELRAVERAQVKSALHDIITQDTISVNEKNMPKFEMRNCFGIIAMTNDDAAISLDQSDRRYLVLRTEAMPRPASYYETLYDTIKDPDKVAAVAYLLQTRDIGEYNGAGRAPATSAKEEMIHAGLNELEMFLIEQSHQYPLAGRLTTVQDVIEMLPKRLERHPRLTQAVSSALKIHFKAEFVGRPVLGDGSRPRIYVINGSPVVTMLGGDLDKIGELYLRERKIGESKGSSAGDDDLTDEFA